MVGEWRKAALGDVVELKRGYDLPRQDRRTGTVPIVSSSGVSGYHSDIKVKGPGVVTGRYGTLGEVFYVSEDFWPLNTTLYVRDFKGNDPRFISYFLRSIDFLVYSDKAAVPGINRNHLHQARVHYPSDPVEQRAIAHILGTLDDKIELNRRTNETLEAMAQAIFKSWFVDFDPVRAKAEGRDPGLPNHIADLFPDRLEGSELGKIPAGWKISTLGEIAENPRRTIRPAQMEESTTYIGLEHMPRQSISLADWDSSESLESNKYEFKRGEILFGKLRPYFHKVGIAPVDGICSTDILVVAAKQPEWFGFVLEHVSSENFVNYTTATSSGTKMPRTNWKDMSSFGVIAPPYSLAKTLNVLLQPFVKRIMENVHESRSLAVTRDTLLPRLISGELRMPDAKRVLRTPFDG